MNGVAMGQCRNPNMHVRTWLDRSMRCEPLEQKKTKITGWLFMFTLHFEVSAGAIVELFGDTCSESAYTCCSVRADSYLPRSVVLHLSIRYVYWYGGDRVTVFWRWRL